MNKRLKKIRVFAASPSDVKEERSRLSGVVEELNRTIGPEKGLVFELVRWETHVTPNMGRAQEIINQQIGPYDIFVGIMWKRFGTPTGGASSGTEEEFDLAFASWKIARKPRIMFYFNQAKYILNTPQEAEQVRRLLEFRMRLEKQALIWTYDGPDEFERIVRQHLQDAVRELTAQARKKGKSSYPDEVENHSVREPVQELFDNAFAEWKRHGVFASRDRLELFRQNVTMVDSSQEQVRFIVESWFKTGEYNPHYYLKSYNMDDIVRICIEIIEKEKDIDLTNGAIKVLGDQDTARSAEILLRIIESNNEYHEYNRLTAIERFWFSKVVNAPGPRIPSVLVRVLKSDPNFKLRKESAYALHNYHTDEVIKALEEALGDSRSQVRFEVVGCLGMMKSASSIEPLLKALEVERYSAKMRKKIVSALGSFVYDQRVRDVFKAIATNNQEESQVMREAKWGLRSISEL